MKNKWLYSWFQIFIVIFWLGFCATVWAAPVEVTDDAGNRIYLSDVPRQVVSLVPSATEIIFAIGAEEGLAGITYHSSNIPGAGDKTIVGGFFSPSAQRIMAINPDLVIVSSVHSEVIEHLDSRAPVLVVNTRQMNDAFRHIQLMGTVFQRDQAAAKLSEKNKRQLELIARKTSKIPEEKRKRVMRIMGQDHIMTPGNDSFQNDMIRAAGGIPPDFEKTGSVVPVTQDEFLRFNPQVIYGCTGDREATEFFFPQEE